VTVQKNNNYSKNEDGDDYMFELDKYMENLSDDLKRRIEYQMVGTKCKGKFVFGGGVIKELGQEAKKFDAQNVLLVSDDNIKDVGLVNTVEEILKDKNINVDIFTDIESEPHATTANKLAKIVNNKSFDLIIGLGGGSVMDMAKMSSVIATNTGTVEEYLKGKEIEVDGLPKILVPTTSGTGSEVSPYVVCSVGEQKFYASKPQFFADVALVDPLLTVTMPAPVTSCTGLDALSHAVEGMTSKISTPISEAFGVKSVKFILSYLEKAYKDGEDLEARYYMSWASSLGMLAYVNVGGLYAHSFSYVMTSHKNWPHGLGCGYSLPYTLMYNLDHIKDILSEVSVSSGIASAEDNKEESAKKAIEAMQELAEKVGVNKCLSEFEVEKDDLDIYAKELVESYYRANNPRDLDLESAKELLEDMWNGEMRYR